MKSGPTLKGCTRRPRSFRAARSASVTVVLPTPLCVPAMIRRGYGLTVSIGDLHTAVDRPDRGAEIEELFVLLIEEVFDSTEKLHGLVQVACGRKAHNVEHPHLRDGECVKPRSYMTEINIHPERLERLIGHSRTT